MSFEVWIALVDEYISLKFMGMTHDDLPDVDYWCWWADGMKPATAANKAIRGAIA
jgi:hypothetical protein